MTYKDLENTRRLTDMSAIVMSAAHELRNSIGVIKAAVYNIKHKAKDEPITSHLDNIDKKIAESDIIIKNLLNHSKKMLPKK